MVRDFIYIDDVISVCMGLIHHSEVDAVLNVGSGAGTRIIDLVNMIKSLVHQEFEISHEDSRKDDIVESVLDISKMTEQLDVEPQTSLYDGLSKTLEFHGLK